jgi:DNA-binding GntR family transcriptional regulator
MQIEKISTGTLRQQIYDQLRTKIISGSIPPGQVMTIQGLANEFGVSVMPVREALWQLESERVVVIESNRRIYVNKLTRKDMEEALDIRLLLEAAAAERACDRISSSDLARMKKIVESMELAFDQPDEFFALNMQFHFTIYNGCDSPLLLQIIDSIWARVGPYLNMNWSENGDRHLRVLDFHWHMCEALVERNKDELRHWLVEDLRHAASVIIPLLDDTPCEAGKGVAGSLRKIRGSGRL